MGVNVIKWCLCCDMVMTLFHINKHAVAILFCPVRQTKTVNVSHLEGKNRPLCGHWQQSHHTVWQWQQSRLHVTGLISQFVNGSLCSKWQTWNLKMMGALIAVIIDILYDVLWHSLWHVDEGKGSKDKTYWVSTQTSACDSFAECIPDNTVSLSSLLLTVMKYTCLTDLSPLGERSVKQPQFVHSHSG